MKRLPLALLLLLSTGCVEQDEGEGSVSMTGVGVPITWWALLALLLTTVAGVVLLRRRR